MFIHCLLSWKVYNSKMVFRNSLIGSFNVRKQAATTLSVYDLVQFHFIIPFPVWCWFGVWRAWACHHSQVATVDRPRRCHFWSKGGSMWHACDIHVTCSTCGKCTCNVNFSIATYICMYDTLACVQGYLKVSVNVLPPGAVAKVWYTAHTHTCTHAQTHTHMHTCTHTHTHMHTCTNTHTHMHTCTHAHMHTHTHTHAHIHTCTHAHTHAHAHTHTHTCTHTHTHAHAHTHTHMHTYTHTCTCTHTHTHMHTYTHMHMHTRTHAHTFAHTHAHTHTSFTHLHTHNHKWSAVLCTLEQ